MEHPSERILGKSKEKPVSRSELSQRIFWELYEPGGKSALKVRLTGVEEK